MLYRARMLAAVLLLASLPACVPVVLTGVGVGVAASVDRRTYGTQVEDQSIEFKLKKKLADELGATSRISVTSFNRVVLLTGQVPDNATWAKVASVATLPDIQIRAVHNELVIGIPAAFSTQSNDTLITSNLKTLLLTGKGFNGAQVKVVTELGTVYLMGLLTEDEASRAAAIASTGQGVNKVIRLTETITPAEAKRLDNPAG